MRIGLIENSVIVNAIEAPDAQWGIDNVGGVWVDLDPYPSAGIGWGWVANAPVAPSPVVADYYILTGAEWVDRFTDDEWEWLKTQRGTGTAAGKALDKMMDAIRWTNSVDVSSPTMDPFYNWLLNNGIPGGQTRIDQLRQAL